MKQTKPDTRRKEEESMQKRELSEERFLIPATNAPEEAGGFSAEELGADVDGMSLSYDGATEVEAAGYNSLSMAVRQCNMSYQMAGAA